MSESTSNNSGVVGAVIAIFAILIFAGAAIGANTAKSDVNKTSTDTSTKTEPKPASKCPDENPCVVREVKTAKVPYGVSYIDDNNLEVGKQELHSEGEFGIAEYIYDVTYQGDKEISSTLVSSGIIKEPVPVVYGRGTKVIWTCYDTTSFDRWASNDNYCVNSYGQGVYVTDCQAVRLDPSYCPGQSGAARYNGCACSWR